MTTQRVAKGKYERIDACGEQRGREESGRGKGGKQRWMLKS